jgi:hypothetical protein
MKAAGQGDGEWEVKLVAGPTAVPFQSGGVLLWQDAENFARFELLGDEVGVQPVAWKVSGGVGSTAISGPPGAWVGATFLRVVRQGDSFSLDFRDDGSDWRNVGSFEQALHPAQEGIHVANTSTLAMTVTVDYFVGTVASVAAYCSASSP